MSSGAVVSTAIAGTAMDPAYATFDTLTIAAELARQGRSEAASAQFVPAALSPTTSAPQPTQERASLAPASAPILARLPRLGESAAANPAPDNHATRFDPASGLGGFHTSPAEAPSLAGASTSGASTSGAAIIGSDGPGVQPIHADPATLRRIDEATHRVPASSGEAKPQPPASHGGHGAAHGEMSHWTLRMEAAVTPHARWIALAAILAALGLTLVVLRGGAPAPRFDAAEEGADRVPPSVARGSVSAPGGSEADDVLVLPGEPLAAEKPAPPFVAPATPAAAWPGPPQGAAPAMMETGSLTAMEDTLTNAAGASARGPVGAPPRARLAQQVLPIGPYRTPSGPASSAPRIDVATRPDYPATNTPGAPILNPYAGTSRR